MEEQAVIVKGGGGGGADHGTSAGAAGGSGIVIVRYHYQKLFLEATGGTITYDGDYQIHTFTSSGTLSVNTLGVDDNVLEYLVIAGGGGGAGCGDAMAGGGGAGGYRASWNSEASGGGGSSETGLTAAIQDYTVIVGAGGAAGEASSGAVDGVNGANSVFGTASDVQISALLHFDGSNDATAALDSSGYLNPLTFAGNAHLDTGVKKFGTASLQLDGNGDYVTMPDNVVFDWGTGDFSISWSIYFTTIHTTTAAYVNNMFGSSLSGAGLIISYKNGSNLFLLMGSTTVIDQSYSLSTGQWYQMEITRSGTSINWFIDGVSRATATSSADADKAAPLAIGANNEAGYRASDRDIAGYMDEIQIIKGRALHTANFTAPSAAYADPTSAVASQGGGGGGGYNHPGAGARGGLSGGSGGGNSQSSTASAAAGTTNQGFAGGIKGSGGTPASGAGGGGAGAAGGNSQLSGGGDGGVGGAGVASTISGSSVTRGGGGGGGGYTPTGAGGGAGGAGGGGAGGTYNRSVVPVAGTVNTGGGGGGSSGVGVGTTGGSGIVIFRYKYK